MLAAVHYLSHSASPLAPWDTRIYSPLQAAPCTAMSGGTCCFRRGHEGQHMLDLNKHTFTIMRKESIREFTTLSSLLV